MTDGRTDKQTYIETFWLIERIRPRGLILCKWLLFFVKYWLENINFKTWVRDICILSLIMSRVHTNKYFFFVLFVTNTYLKHICLHTYVTIVRVVTVGTVGKVVTIFFSSKNRFLSTTNNYKKNLTNNFLQLKYFFHHKMFSQKNFFH